MNIIEILNQQVATSETSSLVIGNTAIDLPGLIHLLQHASQNVKVPFNLLDTTLSKLVEIAEPFDDTTDTGNDISEWVNGPIGHWFERTGEAVGKEIILFADDTTWVSINFTHSYDDVTFSSNLTALDTEGWEKVSAIFQNFSLVHDIWKAIAALDFALRQRGRDIVDKIALPHNARRTVANDVLLNRGGNPEWFALKRPKETILTHGMTGVIVTLDKDIRDGRIGKVEIYNLGEVEVKILVASTESLISNLNEAPEPVVEETEETPLIPVSESHDRKALLGLIDGLRSRLGELSDEDIEAGRPLGCLYTHIAAIALEVDAIQDRQDYMRKFDTARERRRDNNIPDFEVDDTIGDLTDHAERARVRSGRGGRVFTESDRKRTR